MYTDLFIDFDDTLYDTRGNAQLALEELYDHFKLWLYFKKPQDFFTPYWETNTELWKQYASGKIERDYLIVERFRRPLMRGVTPDGLHYNPSQEECLHISDVFLDYCSNKPGLVEGAKPLVDYLKSKHYRMHICSNGFHEVQYRKLRACGLIDYFDTIILSEDAGANKPSKQFYDYALATSHARFSNTIMIGDNPVTDIDGATAFGLDTIYFCRHNEPTTQPPTHKVFSLKEIRDIL